MARFPDAWMDMLLGKNDIVSVVSSYVSLKSKGQNLWGLCPFHSEKTASFSVSPDKQMYYCFGCGAGGGVVQFVMELERLPYMEAIGFLAQRAGMELPTDIDDVQLQRERAYKERLYAACKEAARFFYERLVSEEGAEARKYLAGRGLDASMVSRFGLGFAPNAWDELLLQLSEKGFSHAELLDAGLLVKNAKSGRVYDAYRNRVIFPIIGTNERVLGFGARAMGDETPKYINTSDTPIYNKRRNLYALNLVKREKASDIVIVEGYMDAISLHAGGVKNVVASLGTSLTQLQARLLKRYVSSAYIAYDGDSAGQSATVRGLDVLQAEGLNVKVITLPEGKDPDDFIRASGKDAFDALRDNAMTLNAFKLDRMALEYDLSTEDGRQEYALSGCRFIATLQPVEQERYLAKLARKTGFSVEVLRTQGARAQSFVRETVHRKGNAAQRGRRQGVYTERELAEIKLLKALAKAPHCVMELTGHPLEIVFEDQEFRALAQSMIDAIQKGSKLDVGALLSGLTPEIAQRAAEVFGEQDKSDEPEKIVQDCLHRIYQVDTLAKIQSLQEQAASETATIEEKLALLQQISELKKRVKI